MTAIAPRVDRPAHFSQQLMPMKLWMRPGQQRRRFDELLPRSLQHRQKQGSAKNGLGLHSAFVRRCAITSSQRHKYGFTWGTGQSRPVQNRLTQSPKFSTLIEPLHQRHKEISGDLAGGRYARCPSDFELVELIGIHCVCLGNRAAQSK